MAVSLPQNVILGRKLYDIEYCIFFSSYLFLKVYCTRLILVGRSLNKKNSYDSYLSDICQLIKHNFANVDLCVQKTQMACLAEFCNVDIFAIEIFKPNWDFKF